MIKNYSDYSKVLKTDNIVDAICDTIKSDVSFKDFSCQIEKNLVTTSKKDYKSVINIIDKITNNKIFEIYVSFCWNSENNYILWIIGDWNNDTNEEDIHKYYEDMYNYEDKFKLFSSFLRNIFKVESNKTDFRFSLTGKSDDVNELDDIVSEIKPEKYEKFKQEKKV